MQDKKFNIINPNGVYAAAVLTNNKLISFRLDSITI
jgi:hypothetical protein